MGDHLARRLVNVPTWLLIGRNDVLCSFEECASLALKMRDVNAKCVRLSSVGIKGHSEVGKKLEKWELFQWMKDPASQWGLTSRAAVGQRMGMGSTAALR